MKPEENEDILAATQEIVEENIKDAALWVGGWEKLLELIEDLRDREQEKAYENPKY